jgi:hypothetical protein
MTDEEKANEARVRLYAAFSELSPPLALPPPTAA